MQELSESAVDFSQIQSESCRRTGLGDERSNEEKTMTDTKGSPQTYLAMAVDWTLSREVDQTREAIIKRARSLADQLTRVADGLEADPDYRFNTIGELQGNGVELDTWCHKLGFARQTLKTMREAMAHDAKEAN